MARPAHLASARELLTVRAFARLAGVSQRTVWYDIAGGRLRRAPGLPTRIPRSALATYRAGVPFTLEQRIPRWLLTVREVSYLMGMSPRSVRRRIREGAYVVVRVSARRLLIDAERSRAGVRNDGAVVTIGESVRELLPALQRRLRTRQEFIEDSVRELARVWQQNGGIPLFTVPEIARLSKKSPRTVYHDLSPKKNPLLRAALSRTEIRIRWRDAVTYADRPDATDAILALVVKSMFSDADVAAQADIARGFRAWLASTEKKRSDNPAR